MFTFTSLLGAQSESAASQSILEFDGGVKVLIDVGWDQPFDSDKLKELERHIPTISVILLTHATTAHLGAFAHCCKHFPAFSRIPVFATKPVIQLGRTLLQDVYASTPLARSTIPRTALEESTYSPNPSKNTTTNILFQRPTVEEIAGYFSRVNPLKYSQPHEFVASSSASNNALTITAYSAGHSLGGTIWHIQHGSESVVYAVDWNLAREHVLAGAAWLGPQGGEVIDSLRRPTALICSSRGSSRSAVDVALKKRDDTIVRHIKETVKNGGTVLIPSDSTARVLELAFMLENAWHADSIDSRELQHANACVVSHSCGATMRFARSLLEWMEEGIAKEFEAVASRKQSDKPDSSKAAPFDFKHLKLINTRPRFERWLTRDGPKVILASDVSLEWGYSREMIDALAYDPKNLVILIESPSQPTEATDASSLQQYLWSLYQKGAEASNLSVTTNGATTLTRNISTQPLSNQELPVYQAYLARTRQMQSSTQVPQVSNLRGAAAVEDDDDDFSSISSESEESDEDDGMQGKLLNVTAMMDRSRRRHGTMEKKIDVKVLLEKNGVHDWDVRGKKGRDRMFPFVPKKRKKDIFGDDFGDFIRAEDYLRAEERGDSDLQNGIEKSRKVKGESEKRKMTGEMETLPTANGDEAESSDEEEEPAVPETEGPQKLIITEAKLQFNLRIAFVDFSGRHDKPSFRMLVPKIRPRKMIIIGGDKAETQSLAADCRTLLADETGDDVEIKQDDENAAIVFTPSVGETIDASVDTNAWEVVISDALYRTLQWQTIRKGLRVAAIRGQLKAPAASTDDEVGEEIEVSKAKKAKTEMLNAPDEDLETSPPSGPWILDVLPPSVAAATRSVTAPLHIGDLRLSDLRKRLQAVGLATEYRGEGTLLVGGTVVVRKAATGKIDIEGAVLGADHAAGTGGGPASMNTFYTVRQKVYECLAVVSGS